MRQKKEKKTSTRHCASVPLSARCWAQSRAQVCRKCWLNKGTAMPVHPDTDVPVLAGTGAEAPGAGLQAPTRGPWRKSFSPQRGRSGQPPPGRHGLHQRPHPAPPQRHQLLTGPPHSTGSSTKPCLELAPELPASRFEGFASTQAFLEAPLARRRHHPNTPGQNGTRRQGRLRGFFIK